MTSTDRTKRSVVLVIEEEPLIRLYALGTIGDAGFDVLEAANADEAIEILESRDDIRAIFTDINMPGSMDGLKLAHAVRRKWPPIQIIFVSAYGPPHKKHMPPGSCFFMKPYNPAHIIETLRDLIA
jgi:CheY-like chemotaxis protein